MRVFIAALVLILSFQSWTKADDISDFEIEGMSIDRSLLDFFSENEIDRDYVFPNREFATFANVGKNFKTYEGFQVFYYDNDKKYRIKYLAGKILYNDNIEKCYKKMFQIVDEIKLSLPNTKVQDDGIRKHTKDKTGKSITHQIFFNLKDGSQISVACTDWDVNMQKDGSHADNLAVALRSKEFIVWLANDAYN